MFTHSLCAKCGGARKKTLMKKGTMHGMKRAHAKSKYGGVRAMGYGGVRAMGKG
jgi:hypothetical protein